MSAPSTTEQPQARGGRTRRLVGLVPVLVAFLGGLLLAGVTAYTNNPMSPYDEQAHFDYVVQLAHNHRLADVGTEYDALTLKEVACRGIAVPTGPVDRICPRTYEPINVPPNGISYLLGYSPLFYSVLAAMAVVLKTVFSLSLFMGARLAVALMFAAGCAVSVLVLRRLKVPPVLAVALVMLVASCPPVIYLGATVSPDGLALLLGSTGLLIATLRTSWRRKMLLATLLALVAAQVKISYLPVAAVVLVLTAVWPSPESTRLPERRVLLRRGAAVAAAGVSLPVTVLLVNAWRNATLAPGGTADGGMSVSLAAGAGLKEEVIAAAHMMLAPMTFHSYNSSVTLALFYDVLQTLLVGGCVVAALSSRVRFASPLQLTALAGTAAWLATVLMLPTAFYVMYQATGTQPRYGLPLLPLLLAPVALALGRGRGIQVGVAAVAAVVFSASLWQSLHL